MSETTPVPSQPKITHKLAIRTLILVLLLGSLYLGFQVWKDKSADLKALRHAQTRGWIAAIQFKDDGQQVVAFDPNGKLVASSGWKPGNTDREITWSPSGNRVFFVSDREENNFHIFRWDPTDTSDPDKRTIGSRSRSFPEFPRELVEEADASALIASGGFILEYRPKDQSTVQVLPPTGREITQASEDEGGGATGQFSGIYSHIGNSFKVAKWCKAKEWIAAIMRRDMGEVLVLQKMTPNADGKMPAPVAVVAGDHVDFDVSPKDGTVVYSAQNFQWLDEASIPDQFKNGNKVSRPYAHIVAVIDPDTKSMVAIAKSADDTKSFGAPAINADGSSIAITEGAYENSAGLVPKGLYTCPLTANGLEAGGAKLYEGEVYEPSWSPDSDQLVFAKREKGGKRAIYTIHKDGTAAASLTGDKGNFGTPTFSPQAK